MSILGFVTNFADATKAEGHARVTAILLQTARNFLAILPYALALVLCIANTSNANAAISPLEIIQPRAGLDTNNRFYRTYPGLMYNVQIAAIGGTYPNTYRLDSGPSGMSINSATGELSWASPTESGSPHAVRVTVTDSAGATATVTWSITVTTQGFRFVDAVNGRTVASGGTGTLSNPWRSIADWYISKYDASYRGTFLYFRTGTYRTAEAPIEDGYRLALPGNKPLVWLAYPGEKPVVDVTSSHVAPYGGGCSNLYFEGLEFRNFTTNFGVRIDSNADNVTFRRNIFANLPSGYGGSGTNASGLMISNGGGVGNYFAIVENTFRDMYGQGYGVLGYSTNKVLVQGNVATNFNVSDSKAIGPKTNNSYWFIRDNRINVAQGQGIWVDTYSYTANIEIAFNLVRASNDATLWIGQETATYGRFEMYRNTFIGGDIRISNLSNSSGPISFLNDVVVSTSGGTMNTADSSAAASRMTQSSLLVGSLSAGIVDASGNLTSAYQNYIGQKGYQRSGGTTAAPPLPASTLNILTVQP